MKLNPITTGGLLMYLIVVLFMFLSCSPKISTVANKDDYQSRAHLDYEPFAIIELDSPVDFHLQGLGSIEIKDTGFSVNCDYESVLGLAKSEALRLGGNCIVITEHKLPSVWTSTCHRIKATVYKIPNPEDYEDEIVWNKKRKLKIVNFKGSTEKRPFTAATAASFRYYFSTKTGYSKNYTIKAVTFFDCKSSYFKRTERDSLVLIHEQVHFDIAELYARKFIIEMQSNARTIKEALAVHKDILDEVGRELQLKQDEYDSEVYSDRLLQVKWNDWIAEELRKTASYSEKQFFSKEK